MVNFEDFSDWFIGKFLEKNRNGIRSCLKDEMKMMNVEQEKLSPHEYESEPKS